MTPPCAASPSATGSASPTPTSRPFRPFVEGLLASWDAVEELYAASAARRCRSAPGAAPTPPTTRSTPGTSPRRSPGPASGPLAGKTVAVKDNTAVAGRADDERLGDDGGLRRRAATPPSSPACSRRAPRSPARPSARTSASPAARTPRSTGPVRNPWDETRSAGGSSSGSAALVMAGHRGRRHRRRPGRLGAHPERLLRAPSGTSRPGAWCPTPARSRSSRRSTTSARSPARSPTPRWC